MKQLECLLQESMAHPCKSPCAALHISDRRGICVTTKVSCENCGFSTDNVDLYTKIKSKTGNGPDTGSLNSALLLPVMKSRVGVSDQLLTLSCLNIQPPNITGLQHKVNELSDLIEKLNEEQMIENQKYIKKIHDMAGVEASGDVEFDVSYSRRPQQGCERATQSFAPLIDQTTNKPIAMAVANKLCTKMKCNHKDNKSCKQNFCTGDSIQTSESKLLKETLQKVTLQNILKVRSVTTDASAQIAKAIRETNIAKAQSDTITHYKCFIHRMRSMHGQLRKLRLTSIQNCFDKSVYVLKLASCLRARTRLELTKMRRHYTSDENYIKNATSALDCMLACFQGDHTNCRGKSMVCNAHLSSHSTKYLPYGQYVKLSHEDISKIQTVLGKYVSADCLKSMAPLRTTNQSESMHSRVFRYAPKHTVWSRNFTGLCHSAVHAASLGSGMSLLTTALRLGLPVSPGDPFSKYASRIDKRTTYDSNRQQTHQYKSSRYCARKRQSNRKLIKESAYSNGPKLYRHRTQLWYKSPYRKALTRTERKM